MRSRPYVVGLSTLRSANGSKVFSFSPNPASASRGATCTLYLKKNKKTQMNNLRTFSRCEISRELVCFFTFAKLKIIGKSYLADRTPSFRWDPSTGKKVSNSVGALSFSTCVRKKKTKNTNDVIYKTISFFLTSFTQTRTHQSEIRLR